MYKTTPKKTQASGSGGGGSVLQHDSPHPVWRVTAGERERETNRQTDTEREREREREKEILKRPLYGGFGQCIRGADFRE